MQDCCYWSQSAFYRGHFKSIGHNILEGILSTSYFCSFGHCSYHSLIGSEISLSPQIPRFNSHLRNFFQTYFFPKCQKMIYRPHRVKLRSKNTSKNRQFYGFNFFSKMHSNVIVLKINIKENHIFQKEATNVDCC